MKKSFTAITKEGGMTIDRQIHGSGIYFLSSGVPSLSRRHASHEDLVGSSADFGGSNGNYHHLPNMAIQTSMEINALVFYTVFTFISSTFKNLINSEVMRFYG